MAFYFVTQWISTLNSVTVVWLTTLFVSCALIVIVKRIMFVSKINLVPGPPSGYTLMGNASLMLVPVEGEVKDYFRKIKNYSNKYSINYNILHIFIHYCKEIFNRLLGVLSTWLRSSPIIRVWVGPFPVFFLYSTQAFEVWKLVV